MAISSTQVIPTTGVVPRHVAIVLDGNGRWATARRLPRAAGHLRGVSAVRRVVEACGQRGVGHLTLFAFSSENWRRPAEEVSLLMKLFVRALDREVGKLCEQGIRLRVIGELSRFDASLRAMIAKAVERTEANTRMDLTIAANYGGRWDVLQAISRMLRDHPELAQSPQGVSETDLAPYLCLSDIPEPDLYIRTGGEQRISNFLIWQLAYTELYFTERYWPDFDADDLDAAFAWYRTRERRFGRTSAQIASAT